MPTATDLVTDLPADFEVFGQAVATSMADLLGGTSGQILAKNSNTDMDFVWIANDQGDITAVTAGTGISGGGTSGAVTVTNSMATAIDAKGDLIVGTAADTFARLAVGATNGHVLTVDSTAATGLKYAAAAGGGKLLQLVSGTYSTLTSNATSTYADTGLTATITPTLATSKVLVMVQQNGVAKFSADTSCRIKLFRGASEIALLSWSAGETGTTAINGISGVSINYLDSPATTSATTYKTQFMSSSNSSGVRVQDGSSLSTIILMEIGV